MTFVISESVRQLCHVRGRGGSEWGEPILGLPHMQQSHKFPSELTAGFFGMFFLNHSIVMHSCVGGEAAEMEPPNGDNFIM